MPCAHVIFDTEPTPRGKTESATMDEMSFAMIRSVLVLVTFYPNDAYLVICRDYVL